MASLLRKPQARKQGLKVLAYGVDGSGKSVFGLSFPKIAAIDSESKMGVYEIDEEFGKNLVAVADTSNYYDSLNIIKECIDGSLCETLMIDSETYIYEGMQVACMEVEEERASKKKGNIDDSVVSQRGYGKIKLNSNRMRLLKAQASAKGMTIISTAHKEDIMQKINNNESVKIGEKPSLRKNSQHDYDVILRFYKEKDIATGEQKYLAEVEKDTTRTLKIGQIIENPTYELFKSYIERNNKLQTINTKYDQNLVDNMKVLQEEQKSFDELVTEFTDLFKVLKAKNPANATIITNLLKSKGIDSYKNPEHCESLKEVLAEMNKM